MLFYLPPKTLNMKILGIVLIVLGIVMMVFRSFSFTQQEKIVDLGPLEINKNEKKTVNWPLYAGGIAAIAGVVILVSAKKQA